MERDLTTRIKTYKETHGEKKGIEEELQTFLLLSDLIRKILAGESYETELERCLDNYTQYFTMFDSISISSYDLAQNQDLDSKKACLCAMESFASYTQKDSKSLSALLSSYRYLLTLLDMCKH